MSTREIILEKIVSYFLQSAERNQFNGLRAATLLEAESSAESLCQDLVELIEEGRVTCVFARYSVNMHIKRLPDISAEDQIAGIGSEQLSSFCVYPSSAEVMRATDVSAWNNRPFAKELLLARPQLDFVSFDLAAIERYTNDPRYKIHFEDYMGTMSIGDDAFREMGFPDRDKVSLQTFGLGIGEDKLPYLVVFLRYLASLSPEHQQYWKSFQVSKGVRMVAPYCEASFGGTFWKNRSVRHAIMQEIRLINQMLSEIYGQRLFRDFEEKDVPIGVTAFLRPTSKNFDAFVLALDKLLSDRLDLRFFEGKVALEEESPRQDGKLVITKKGSLRLLEEWLLSALVWESDDAVRAVIMGPLKKVRKLRQKPAHDFSRDMFSSEYHRERRKLLGEILNSLQNMRLAFATHPAAQKVVAPDWLDEGNIDIF